MVRFILDIYGRFLQSQSSRRRGTRRIGAQIDWVAFALWYAS